MRDQFLFAKSSLFEVLYVEISLLKLISPKLFFLTSFLFKTRKVIGAYLGVSLSFSVFLALGSRVLLSIKLFTRVVFLVVIEGGRLITDESGPPLSFDDALKDFFLLFLSLAST